MALKWAKSAYVKARRVPALIRKERSTPFTRSLSEKWSCWKSGFLSESRVFYDWSVFDPGEYVTDLERFIFMPSINGHHAIIVDDKRIFRKVFGAVLPVPRNIGRLDDGNLTSDVGNVAVDLADLLERETAFVTKPVCGGGGSSIRIFEKGDHGWTLNSQLIEESSLVETIRHLPLSIVDAKVENGVYARRINPHSLNTIRILTMIDPDSGRPFIARAIHRFGTSRSAPADNWTRGGLSVSMDMETGVLGKGASYPVAGTMSWHSEHPETGARLEGVVVPGWGAIREKLLTAANIFAHVPYIGWDVVAREDTFVVIEGNSNTDVNLLQIHGPLLRDPRVKRFYEYHHALSPLR